MTSSLEPNHVLVKTPLTSTLHVEPNLSRMQSHMARVAALIISLKGDLYGEYLRSSVVGLMSTSAKMSGRINPDMYIILMELLNTDYAVTPLAKDTTFRISTKTHPFLGGGMGQPMSLSLDDAMQAAADFMPFTLRLKVLTRQQWSEQTICLDIDTLAQNTFNLYFRGYGNHMSQVTNRIAYVLSRIRMKQHCLIHPVHYKLNVEQAFYHTKKSMKKAYRKAMQGWIMDDLLIGPPSWIMNRWDIQCHAYPHIRTATGLTKDESALSHLNTASCCSLCHETFQHADIVIELACQHTFHFYCDSKQCKGGLHAWYIEQGKDTCPLCRAPNICIKTT